MTFFRLLGMTAVGSLAGGLLGGGCFATILATPPPPGVPDEAGGPGMLVILAVCFVFFGIVMGILLGLLMGLIMYGLSFLSKERKPEKSSKDMHDKILS